ncbi:MAG TPA: hypothetical protein ENK16_00245 [Chromatiales bacterium]|nr:hypothetical protein [Chromatiales bacterium]
MRKTWTRLLGIGLLAFLLAGCGLKGRLYLPETAAGTSATTDVTTDSASEPEDTDKSPDGS